MTIQLRQNYATGKSPFDNAEAANVPGGSYGRFGKRVLDLVIVTLIAVPVALVVGVLALLIMRDGGSPFYSQARVGRHGRNFRMWKLRSMVVDADARLEAHLASCPAARAEWDHAQKLRNDPRITRIGQFIRKTSLDELPQLWNVLTGEMSFVGPRPMMPCQRTMYPGFDYYALRPGITGFWQISARNASSFAQRARFDSRYRTRVSLGTDLGTLWRTVGVVARGTGQ